jgi:hypothetical protein
VFTFIDLALPYRQVDVSLEDPLPFATLQAQSIVEHGEGYAVRVASLEHLLAMKQKFSPCDRKMPLTSRCWRGNS